MTSTDRLRTAAVGVLLSLLVAAPALALPAPRSPAASEALAREIFAEIIGTNTTHAIGSAKAADALAARFLAGGFPAADVYVGGPRPDKMNIVVRLRGKGKGKPVLFNAHLDVVEAIRETWSLDPFVLTEKDGFFYGRGTVDVKNEVAILAANLIRLKKEGYTPDRDIILFFNDWMLKEHRPLIEAGLVINHDAGKGQALHGEKLWNTIQTAEKVYATYSLTTAGAGGHSSLPPRDNAIARLARALAKLDAYQFPVRFSDTTRQYLEAASGRVGAETGAAARALLANPADVAALEKLRDAPVFNAQAHSTCPVTLVQGGQSESALPMRAKATIQCRLLPDENTAEVLATLRRVIDDPAVEVGVVTEPNPSPAATLDKAVVAKVEQITSEMWPGVKVVPVMSSGASDNVFFRRAGLPTFGVSGTFVEESDLRAHGRDERVGVNEFYESLEFSYRLIRSLAAAR
ncbi:MAG: M20/M25/M40 family metallo-hydrolase [Proteobacteria bacterium]|nr:M20/M25/M40 family metallo-hydrolase [Pseudomonadota bacterium]